MLNFTAEVKNLPEGLEDVLLEMNDLLEVSFHWFIKWQTIISVGRGKFTSLMIFHIIYVTLVNYVTSRERHNALPQYYYVLQYNYEIDINTTDVVKYQYNCYLVCVNYVFWYAKSRFSSVKGKRFQLCRISLGVNYNMCTHVSNK